MKNLKYTALILFAFIFVLPKVSFAGFDMTLRNPISDDYLGTIYAKVNNWFDNDKLTNGLKIKFNSFNGSMCTAIPASEHGDFHKGIDFPVQNDTSIVSVGAGRVYYRYPDPIKRPNERFCENIGALTGPQATCGGGSGNHYKVDHEGDTSDGKGLVTVYSHLKHESVTLPVGTKVSCGQQLGLSASSGHSTGPHLHFAVSTKGESIVANYIDPFVGMCSRPNGNSSGLPRWTSIDANEQPTTTCDPRPLAPSNLRITDNGLNENKLTLEFKDNALNDTGVKLERKTGTGGWKYILTIPAVNNANTSEYFANSDLSPGINYCYRLKSVNNGIESPYSNEICGKTKTSNSAPLSPSNLVVYSQGFRTLQIDFKDNASNETDTKVERSVGWFSRNFVGYRSLGILEGSEQRTFTDTGLSSFQIYCYRLKSVNSYGSSSYSEEKCANTLVAPDAPKAPTNLTMNSNNTNANQKNGNTINAGGAVITISFMDNATDETEYRIERKAGNAEYTSYKNISAFSSTGIRTFTDVNVAVNTTYCYKVRAYNANNNIGYSDYSNEVCGSVGSTDAVPNAPSDVYISDITTNSLNIYFTDNALNEKFIYLEGKIGINGIWESLYTYGALTDAKYWYISHTALTPDTTYCYRLKASNAFGFSAYSNEGCGKTLKVEVVPNAPSNLYVDNATATSLQIHYKDNSNNESNFVTERKAGDGAWETYRTTNGHEGTDYWYWENTNLSSNTTFCYRMRATNSVGNSALSNEACGTTLGNAPNAPSDVYVNNLTTNSLQVNFKDNASNENDIMSEIKIGTNGSWQFLKTDGTLPGTDYWQFNHNGLSPATTYCYRLKARNIYGDSQYSNEACGTTLGNTPNAPSDISITNITVNSLRMNFRDNAFDENHFVIERKIGSGSFAFLENLNGLSGNYTQWLQYSGLSSDTTYCFRMKAVNNYGSSNYSNEGCGTTLSNLPNAPSDVFMDNFTTNSAQVHFKDNSIDENYFLVEQKTGYGGAWQYDGYFSGKVGTDYWYWTETGLSPGTYYCFRMYAQNNYGNSKYYSNEACGLTRY